MTEAELRFSSEDIIDLTTKLDAATASFSREERALLKSLLVLAGEAIAARSQDEVEGFDASGVQWTGLVPGTVLVLQNTVTADGSPLNLVPAGPSVGGDSSGTILIGW